MIFLHVGTYVLQLQIDDVILQEWGQAPPKEAIRTLRFKKIKEV